MTIIVEDLTSSATFTAPLRKLIWKTGIEIYNQPIGLDFAISQPFKFKNKEMFKPL
jgi:hypothetical protein